MKRLKFLIALVAAVMAAEGVMAVTLPSTSYNPYSSGYDGSATYTSSTPYGVSMSSTSMVKLSSEYDDTYVWTDHCSTDYPGPENLAACFSCVEADQIACYSACSGDPDCEDWCDSESGAQKSNCGRSLPLDGGLSFMLSLMAGFIIVKMFFSTELIFGIKK